MLLNPVVLSVIVLIVLSLARINVIFSLLIAAGVGGLTAGLSLEDTFITLDKGLGGEGETALSSMLLGILAVMMARSGITYYLMKLARPLIQAKRADVLFVV